MFEMVIAIMVFVIGLGLARTVSETVRDNVPDHEYRWMLLTAFLMVAALLWLDKALP